MMQAVDILLIVILGAGVLPFFLGLARLGRGCASARPRLASVLLCTLAFNLTFIWQELWLVLPKAMAGLSPVLFHNDHDWAVRATIADLLQGTGALATLASGLVALVVLSMAAQRLSATWRLFVWWLAFQGLFQSLTQLEIGAILPGNDVGRALAYLGATALAKTLLRTVAVLAMALAGIALASRAPPGLAPADAVGQRAFAWSLLLAALGCVLLSVPLREPRELVEVVLIPIFVNVIGVGWVVFGAWPGRVREAGADVALSRAGPAAALVAVLLVFQLVLRPGVHF